MAGDWKFRIEDEIGLLSFDMPGSPINKLTSKNLNELNELLEDIHQKKDLKVLLIASAKPRFFIVGADIKEIESIHTERDAYDKAQAGKAVFQRLEDLKIPTVCVINGACLGGGYELALACRYRTASFSEDVKIGLPEVHLGILPGFGGSIRMPRLLGILKSLPLILAGQMLGPDAALKKGLVDRLFYEQTLLEDSKRFARDMIHVPGTLTAQKKKTDPLTWFLEQTPVGRTLVFHQAKKDVLKKTKGHYPAPLEILRLISETYGRSGAEIFEKESRAFSKLGATHISKNLIKVFYLNEKYKKQAWTSVNGKLPPVKKCGVVGAGVMGGGIAQRVSSRDIPVRVKDIQEQALGHALNEARGIYEGDLKRRKIDRHTLSRQMGLISVGLKNDGLPLCDMLIEAVVENMEIKKKVFEELDRIAKPDAILSSNTSSLSITEMAKVCRKPERVVGLHFFNPVHRMPLVEVIRGKQTSAETLERTIQFARTLGKTVIVAEDQPGFLVNRLLLPYLNEAAYLLEAGLSPLTIDSVATSFGMPMGPIELVDQVGIDVAYKVAHVLESAFGARMKVALTLEKAFQKGLLGKKSGKGFYFYKGKKKSVNSAMLPRRSVRSSLRHEDALKRMVYVMINEAARCLEEKVVDAPETVDVGMIFGAGFPPFRAGLLRYADAAGLDHIVSDLERFGHYVDADRFAVSPYLKQLASNDKSFYQP